VHFSVTLINQTDDKCNVEVGATAHTFKAGAYTRPLFSST